MKLHKFNYRVLWLLILLTLLAISISAQSGKSWMNGIVFDESDTNGIGGALVELIGDPDSARMRSKKESTNTDKDGKYSFKLIPYGDYIFRVSASGFTTYEIKLYVASDVATELHVKLRKQK